MSVAAQFVPFESRGLTVKRLDDFSIKLYYRGVKVDALKSALSTLAMHTNSVGYELVWKEPCYFVYVMRFYCAQNTYDAMGMVSEVRKVL